MYYSYDQRDRYRNLPVAQQQAAAGCWHESQDIVEGQKQMGLCIVVARMEPSNTVIPE